MRRFLPNDSPTLFLGTIITLIIMLACIVVFTRNRKHETTTRLLAANTHPVNPKVAGKDTPKNTDIVDLRIYFRKNTQAAWELESDGAYKFQPDQSWIWITIEIASEPNAYIKCVASISDKKIAEKTYITDSKGNCDIDLFANGKTRQFSLKRPKTKTPLTPTVPNTNLPTQPVKEWVFIYI